MIKLDASLLTNLGIEMTEEEQKTFLADTQAMLEERVGLAISELVDDDELKELMELTEKGDSQDVTAWLEEHVPSYKEVIQDEFDIMMGDLAENADKA
jgi:hypothetical protein